MTRQELVRYLEDLGGHDRSEAVALRALFVGVDEEGVATREAWEGLVSDHLSRRRRTDPRGTDWSVPSVDGEGLVSEDGQVGSGSHPRYLDDHILPRLEAAGIVARVDHGEGGRWKAVRVAPDLWELVRPEREHFVGLLDSVLHRIEEGSGEPSTFEATPGEGSLMRGDGLTKVYKRRKVVNDVDIHVRQGEIVGLLGPNGAGKTTTFYMIVGLIAPNAGRVFLDEKEITSVPMFRRARMGMGYLAQEPSIFRKLTVEENVLAILETLGLSRKEKKARLEELLQELSISHLRKNKAYSLSGGERRRLEITRALVQRPKFMLLDEPFAGIDPIAVNDIQEIVSELKHRNIGVIISDHNVEQTLDIVDRAYIMYEGRIRVSGTVSELVWNDEVAEIYLGPTLTARMRERYPRPEDSSLRRESSVIA